MPHLLASDDARRKIRSAKSQFVLVLLTDLKLKNVCFRSVRNFFCLQISSSKIFGTRRSDRSIHAFNPKALERSKFWLPKSFGYAKPCSPISQKEQLQLAPECKLQCFWPNASLSKAPVLYIRMARPSWHSTPVGHGTHNYAGCKGMSMSIPPPHSSPDVFFFLRPQFSPLLRWGSPKTTGQLDKMSGHGLRVAFFSKKKDVLFLQTWSYTWLWWGFIPSFPSKDQPNRNYPKKTTADTTKMIPLKKVLGSFYRTF